MKNKLLVLFFSTVISLVLSACGGSSGGGGGSAPNQGGGLATISEQEATSDLTNLNTKEYVLSSAGLKFMTKENADSSTTYYWNNDVLTNYVTNNPSSFKTEMTNSLNSYISTAEAYLAKYSQNFNLKKDDGTISSMTLKSSVKDEINAKISLSRQTIEKLKTL